MRDLHVGPLADAAHPALRAVAAFLSSPAPAAGEIVPGNLIASVDGLYVHEIPEARRIWSSIASPAPDPNPSVRIGGTAWLRYWSPQVGGASYGQARTAADYPVVAQAGAGLRWLLEQPNAVHIDDRTVCVSWVDGRPDLNPTAAIYPLVGAPEVPEWPGVVNVAILRAKPPAKIIARYFWAGDGRRLAARLRTIYAEYLRAAAIRWPYGDTIATVPAWPHATSSTSGAEATIRYLVAGQALPSSIQRQLLAAVVRGAKVRAATMGMAAICVAAAHEAAARRAI
jgi:hypothetical protein